MEYLQEIRKIHEEIQKKIFFMLPEKWESLYLYASVVQSKEKEQTGEMFFYYFPKGILQKKAINVYEVPSKFNIDENEYYRLADELYDNIKKLRKIQIENNEKPWSNITITMEKITYKVIYNYEELGTDQLDSNKRRIIWKYKYLNLPYHSLNRKERAAIDEYEKKEKPKEKIFEIPLYAKSSNKELENIASIEKKLEFVTDDTIKEMEFIKTHVPKSQILHMK